MGKRVSSRELIEMIVRYLPPFRRMTIPIKYYNLPMPAPYQEMWAGIDLTKFTKLSRRDQIDFWVLQNIFASLIFDLYVDKNTTQNPLAYLRDRLGYSHSRRHRVFMRIRNETPTTPEHVKFAIGLIVQLAGAHGIDVDVDGHRINIYEGDHSFGIVDGKAYAPELEGEVFVLDADWGKELRQNRPTTKRVSPALAQALYEAEKLDEGLLRALVILLNMGDYVHARFLTAWVFPELQTTLYNHVLNNWSTDFNESEFLEIDFVSDVQKLLVPRAITNADFNRAAEEAWASAAIWTMKERQDFLDELMMLTPFKDGFKEDLC